MASLLNNASLLLNPAGSIIAYEEDKIFSVLPSNGTGDFTFTGGDGGTRVNQQGYIESTPANLVLNSEIFSSGWNLGATTITSNSVIAPNGTLTADSFSSNSGVAAHVVYQFFPSINGTYTFSCYVKKVNSRYVEIKIAGSAVNWIAAVFDLDTATVTKSEASNWTGLTTTITNIGDGWYRFSISGTGTTDGSFNAGIQYVDSATPAFATNYADVIINGSGVVDYYIWGAMLNLGSTAKPYQPTTDRLNYPRITYQNGRGALLQEPQRTNIVTNSEDATQQGLNNMSATGSTAISPDGTQNADTITPTAGTSDHYLITNVTSVTNGASFTLSAFIKKKDSDYVHFGSGGSGAFGSVAYSFLTNTFFNISGPSAYSVVNFGNGWIRLTITGTTGGTDLRILLTPTDSSGARTFNANGTDGLYVWGLQIEAGEFGSTYIPTTSATVTRPMDQFFKNDSSALTTTDWTFYMSGVNIGKNQNSSNNNIDAVNWSFDSGGGPYGPNSLHNYSNNLYYYDTVNGAANLGAIGSTTTKFAVTKNGTTFKLFRDGVLFSTNVLSLASNVWDSFRMYGDVDAQGQAFSNNPSTLAILPSALSDAEAQTLTTIRSGSGGNISYYGPYTIHSFTGSATFTPSFTGPVEVLVVAGGGGGGNANDAFWEAGGGGGAGGLLYASSYGVSTGTGITVTVGAGGVGGKGNANPRSGNGSNSVFGGLTAIGGGGGGGAYYAATSGGSGGGGDAYYGAGGLGIPYGTGITGQGNRGGSGNLISSLSGAGGGGGGAGAVGGTGQSSGNLTGGAGGDGLPYSISGFSNYYAGGGGGKTAGNGSGAGGAGGLGGGGIGGAAGNVAVGNPGVDYTGGGGGGAMATSTATGAGGTGVVIVRYLT
jgi:hypothetical protein